MKLQRIVVDHYRSIEHIEIEFPVGKPVVLFGPNNAGKSNILLLIVMCLLSMNVVQSTIEI